ncbi:MAG: Bacterial Ig-like domain (group 3), partial [Chloroflexi bacterium]|nr:Bacterial Ig-like domain (group 3) [Chloroflexota bacterium]
MKLAGVHVGRAPAIPVTKLRRMSRPCGVWTTSGWNWIPYSRRAGSAMPANGVEGVWAVEESVLLGDGDRGRAVLAAYRRHHLAAELEGHEVQPVADAQDRHAAGPQAGIGPGGGLLVHGGGAAREDDRSRPAFGDVGPRGVERQKLGVDVELAHAAGDELCVLAAEVENDDGVGNGAGLDRGFVAPVDRAAGDVRLRSLGSGCVEGDLQVRLDLGVVGGQHAVPGVRRLAMHGPAALPYRALVVVRGRAGGDSDVVNVAGLLLVLVAHRSARRSLVARVAHPLPPWCVHPVPPGGAFRPRSVHSPLTIYRRYGVDSTGPGGRQEDQMKLAVGCRITAAVLAALLAIPFVPAAPVRAAETPTVTVTSSDAASTYGQSVTFTAAVSGSSGEATGAVQFAIDGVDLGGPVSLASGSASSDTIADLTAGTHAVTGHFTSGDTNVYENADGTLTGGQVVDPAVLTVSPDAKTIPYGS